MNCACGKPMAPTALQCASCEKRYLDGLVRAARATTREEAHTALANARAGVAVTRPAPTAPPRDASDSSDPFVRFLASTQE